MNNIDIDNICTVKRMSDKIDYFLCSIKKKEIPRNMASVMRLCKDMNRPR